MNGVLLVLRITGWVMTSIFWSMINPQLVPGVEDRDFLSSALGDAGMRWDVLELTATGRIRILESTKWGR